MEIHVIRHTPINFDKNRCYGRLDVPLAHSFKKDVEKMRKKIISKFDLVYTSPSARCKELAKALQFENTIEDERLNEIDFGDWEGKLWSEINQEKLNTWMKDFVTIRAGNGESLKEMFQRVSSFFNELRLQQCKKVLIITHSGVIRCTWAYLLSIPLENIFKLPVGFHEHFIFKMRQDSLLDSIVQMK